MSATTVVMAATNRIMRAFRRAGATSPDTAKTLEEVGCRRNLSFRKLERRGVLVEVPGPRYYLDEDAAEEFATYRRTIFLLSLAVILVVFGVLLSKNIR
jgi:hypothetical protein